jgi:hypothetical protein
MGGFTHGKRWQPWENDLILSGMGPTEIAKITGRTAVQVTSQRTRLRRLTVIKSVKSDSKGTCIFDHSFPGPDGWTTDNGPPCLLCNYHTAKFLRDTSTSVLRDECRYCNARQAWADYNGGLPQRPDYFDFLPDQYQTEEIDICGVIDGI